MLDKEVFVEGKIPSVNINTKIKGQYACIHVHFIDLWQRAYTVRKLNSPTPNDAMIILLSNSL